MRTAQNYIPSACGASLISSPALAAVKTLFTHFHATQWGTPAQWYGLFKQQVYALLSEVGYSEDQAEYLLRSGAFCNFVQQAIKAA